MGTIANKLRYLIETKRLIREAIIEKKVEVPAATPFRDYAQKILDIKTGLEQDEFLPMTISPAVFNFTGSVLYEIETGNITTEEN